MKEVVHCKTQKDWLFVKEYLKYTINKGSFLQFPYIPLFEDNCGNEHWIQNNHFILYSFDEWCRREGISKLDEENIKENYDYLIEFLNKLGIN